MGRAAPGFRLPLTQPWNPSGWVGFSPWAILGADSVGLSRLLSQSASKTTFFAPKTAYLGAKLGILAGHVSPTGFWAGWADRSNPDRRARALHFHDPTRPKTRPSPTQGGFGPTHLEA